VTAFVRQVVLASGDIHFWLLAENSDGLPGATLLPPKAVKRLSSTCLSLAKLLSLGLVSTFCNSALGTFLASGESCWVVMSGENKSSWEVL
jgi:hypothetical protein